VFEVLTCPVCGSEFLTAIGTMANAADECPFCKLIQRYHTDPRLQMSFPGCRDVNSNQTSTKTMPLSAVEPD
jgi:hypothetical protein